MKKGVTFLYKTNIESIKKTKDGAQLTAGGKGYMFDNVICTLPSPAFIKITQGLPENYKKKLTNLKGIGAVNVVLSLKQSFLKDGTYWLNINELDHPFLAVVEHTNFIDKKNYNNEHFVYIGNYFE